MSALPAGSGRRRWLVPAVVTLTASPLVGSWILAAGRTGGGPAQVLEGSDALWWLGWWTSIVVGVLVLRRRPRNTIGWLLVVGGAAATLVGFLSEYARLALERRPDLPGGTLAAWVGCSLIWVQIVSVPLILQVFPDGRLRGRAGTALWWTTVAAFAVTMVDTAIVAWPLRGPALLVTFDEGETISAVAEVASSVLFLTILCSTVVPVVRYRHVTGVVRQQVKWLMLAGGWLLVMMLGSELVPAFGGWAVRGVSVTLLPLAIGVAVSRYRLYDVDRLISRSVSYALVTAVMVACYAVVAVVPSMVLELRSDLLVAAATLLAAAVFRPLRARAGGGRPPLRSREVRRQARGGGVRRAPAA